MHGRFFPVGGLTFAAKSLSHSDRASMQFRWESARYLTHSCAPTSIQTRHTDQVQEELPKAPRNEVSQDLRPKLLIGNHVQQDRIGRRFTALFAAESVETGSGRVPSQINPEPLIFDAEEWALLKQAIAQRVRLLAQLAEEVRQGSFSAEMKVGHVRRTSKRLDGSLLDAILAGADAEQLVQVSPARLASPPLVLCAFDVARHSDAAIAFPWFVRQDFLDQPTGLGAALLLRSIVGRQFADEMTGFSVTPPTEYLTRLREVLADLAPHGSRAPRTVVLAPTSGQIGHAETAFLATRLGHHLASPADLVVLKDRVWLRTLSGTEPVDVVLRATSGVESDPLTGNYQSAHGVAALSLAWRHDGVGLANPLGLRSIESLPGSMTNDALEALGGQRLRLRKRDDSPGTEFEPIPTLRMHAVLRGEQVHVFPGGTVSQVKNGIHSLQDVWVRTGTPTRSSAKGRAEVPIDLSDSVPTSAAEGLFWAGRNAEQAEVAARVLRMVIRHAADGEPEVLTKFVALAYSVTHEPNLIGPFSMSRGHERLAPLDPDSAAPPSTDLVNDAVSDAIETLWNDGSGSVVRAIGFLNRNLHAARPFVSASTWNILDDLNATMASQPQDTIDFAEHAERTLRNLAALSGLIEESTVRSPARTFLLIGRRLQRMHRLIAALHVALDTAGSGASGEPSPGLFEGLLNAWESLIAYRRRFRSDMNVDQVLHLLVVDQANPRSLAFQAAQLSNLFDELPAHTAHEPLQRQISRLRERTGDETAWVRYPVGTLSEVDVLTKTLMTTVLDEWFSVDRMRGSGLTLTFEG